MDKDTILAMVPDCKTVNRYLLMRDGTIGLVFGVASDCVLLCPMWFDGGNAMLGKLVSYSFDRVVSVVAREDIVDEGNGNAIVQPSMTTNKVLTRKQIEWAMEHDWALRPDWARMTVVVQCDSLDREYLATASWVGSFKALRDWAGY